MKPSLIVCAVVLSFVFFGTMNAGAAEPSAAAQVAFVFKSSGSLNLTDGQRKEFDALAKAAQEQGRIKGADIEAIKSEELTKLEAVLSKDQLDKLNALRKGK